MKKEEFPTFLNEQPTIIFGRTGRELMIIAIGICSAYVAWLRLGGLFPAGSFIGLLVKVLAVITCAVLALVVAFIKVASRPLEEWMAAFVFFTLIPKVYIYIPMEEKEPDESQSDMLALSSSNRRSEDDYDDDDE